MARFMAQVQGSRGQVHRLGGTESGASATAQGWHIGGKVRAHVMNGEDVIDVYITGGSNGGIEIDLGTYKLVAGKPVKVA